MSTTVRTSSDNVFSRPLLLAWAGWLLGSWAVNVWIDGQGPMSTMSLVPIVRGMLQSILLGLTLVWPAWRMSQAGRHDAGTQTAADIFLLLLVSQTIVWAMRMITGWTEIQTVMIIAVVVVTGCAAAQITWWGRLARTGAGRSLAMVGCALVLAGGWVWTWITGTTVAPEWSPMSTLWIWADPDHGHADADRLGMQLVAVFGVTALAWASTRMLRLRRRATQRSLSEHTSRSDETNQASV